MSSQPRFRNDNIVSLARSLLQAHYLGVAGVITAICRNREKAFTIMD